MNRDRSRSRTIVYTKNYAPALALILMRRVGYRLCVAFEVHVPPTGFFRRFVLENSDGVIANSHALAAELHASRGLPPAKVLGTHQGVDLEPFEQPFDRRAFRASLGLPVNKQVVVYTGKIFYAYREVEAILEAAQHPSLQDVLFVLVGGREDHVELLRSDVHAHGPANVLFTGFVPPRDVHLYQRAADALLLYYPSGMRLNAYRSPGKLFEYMASGVPIVAVDLLVLREVLGDPPAALMVRPDSPVELARGILEILSEPDEALALANQARERVKQFTWDRRADEVLRFLRERLGGSGVGGS